MPPAAACAGAACWAAKYKKYALLRSVFCRTACQHAAAKPINQRTAARCVGAAAGMGVQAIRCGTFLYRGWNRTREIQKPLVFGGVLFHISFAVERNMAAGGIHAGRGCSPQSENEQRAVEDAGPYAVRHRRAVRGSGSGERRTSDSMRNLFVPLLESDKGNPKTVGFWRRFCILLPPRAKGCRAGARNIPVRGMEGTSNGPSGTPAPTEGQTRVRRYSAVRRCGPSGTPAPTQ